MVLRAGSARVCGKAYVEDRAPGSFAKGIVFIPRYVYSAGSCNNSSVVARRYRNSGRELMRCLRADALLRPSVLPVEARQLAPPSIFGNHRKGVDWHAIEY